MGVGFREVSLSPRNRTLKGRSAQIIFDDEASVCDHFRTVRRAVYSTTITPSEIRCVNRIPADDDIVSSELASSIQANQQPARALVSMAGRRLSAPSATRVHLRAESEGGNAFNQLTVFSRVNRAPTRSTASDAHVLPLSILTESVRGSASSTMLSSQLTAHGPGTTRRPAEDDAFSSMGPEGGKFTPQPFSDNANLALRVLDVSPVPTAAPHNAANSGESHGPLTHVSRARGRPCASVSAHEEEGYATNDFKFSPVAVRGRERAAVDADAVPGLSEARGFVSEAAMPPRGGKGSIYANTHFTADIRRARNVADDSLSVSDVRLGAAKQADSDDVQENVYDSSVIEHSGAFQRVRTAEPSTSNPTKASTPAGDGPRAPAAAMVDAATRAEPCTTEEPVQTVNGFTPASPNRRIIAPVSVHIEGAKDSADLLDESSEHGIAEYAASPGRTVRRPSEVHEAVQPMMARKSRVIAAIPESDTDTLRCIVLTME